MTLNELAFTLKTNYTTGGPGPQTGMFQNGTNHNSKDNTMPRQYAPLPGERKTAETRLTLWPSLMNRMRQAAYAERRPLQQAFAIACEMYSNHVEHNCGGNLPALPDSALPPGRPRKRPAPKAPTAQQELKQEPIGGEPDLQDILKKYRKKGV